MGDDHPASVSTIFNRSHLKKVFSSDPPVEDAAGGEADKYRR
jgi:hypothetical protein